MVFRRRKKRGFFKKVKEFFLPENGWRRALEYLSYRIKRLPDTPHRIALGLACGVFASFTPLFGFHILIGAFASYVARANVLAGFIGTFFGNPLTFPFIAAVNVQLGSFILERSTFPNLIETSNKHWSAETDLTNLDLIREFLLDVYSDKFLPYSVGGFLCGLMMGLIVYFLSKPIITTYQRRKRQKLARKMRK